MTFEGNDRFKEYDEDDMEEEEEEEEEEIDEKEEIEKEIQRFEIDFPGCPYKIIDKIGQGTFSSVYIAQDLEHYKYDNSRWCKFHVKSNEPKNATCGKVALKRIYATSSAARIHSELNLLKQLRGHEHISPLINCLRYEDQVVAVLPYFEHDNFKNFYKKMSRDEISRYMFCMLSALEHVHKHGYIHRDVKPSNFLYNVAQQTGVLIDFGLAQRAPDPEYVITYDPHKAPDYTFPKGYLINETRPSIRASRAGTRGFRAPEVLFKYSSQSQAIDVWSAGVTLLCILTRQFPFFQSNDDIDAILEIGNIFGFSIMSKVANSLHRVFNTNIPSIGPKMSLRGIIEKLNPGMVSRVGLDCIDLLKKLMNPFLAERITAAEALEHPFLVEHYIDADPVDEW